MSKSTITIKSIYGARERVPSVVIEWGENSGQLTPTEARTLGMRFFEAAENAEQDAFMFEMVKEHLGGDGPAFGVLKEFREWRLNRGDKK